MSDPELKVKSCLLWHMTGQLTKMCPHHHPFSLKHMYYFNFNCHNTMTLYHRAMLTIQYYSFVTLHPVFIIHLYLPLTSWMFAEMEATLAQCFLCFVKDKKYNIWHEQKSIIIHRFTMFPGVIFTDDVRWFVLLCCHHVVLVRKCTPTPNTVIRTISLQSWPMVPKCSSEPRSTLLFPR